MSGITKSARGERCLVWLSDCVSATDTTVFAHAPSRSGMGRKSPDFWGAYACLSCHAKLDGRAPWGEACSPATAWLDAIFRTQARLIEKGLLRAS